MRQLTVLLVEDNPRDVRLTQRAFKQAGLPHDLRVVRDGDEALAYLHREGAYKETETAPRPDVILLDLNLPRMGGATPGGEAGQSLQTGSYYCPDHI